MMNEALPERFRRGHRGGRRDEERDRADVWLLPPKLNHRIRDYYQGDVADGGHWLSRPEVPSAAEVLDTDVNSAASSDVVEIAPNKPCGAFESKEDYLSMQYELLREDAERPIREAVSKLRMTPAAAEDAFDGQVGIYDKVHVCGITFSTRGVAVRVTFSLVRAGKKILWEQSKRLTSGSLVVLTPKGDMFASKAVVATVAARPLKGLQENPPEIDLFFACTEDLEIDPAAEYVMIEERSGFFEADRHTLLGLQHMMKETFPLSDYFIQGRSNTSTVSSSLQQNPRKDLRSVLIDNKHETYENVNIVTHWPVNPQSEMDTSQLHALRSMLTKKLAIVQGPPGTGKTFVSVQAIKVMLANRSEDDPPIIIACQTNHAIDQILRHIAHFEQDFVRLGGRSKDQDVIKKRTLYEVRMDTSQNPPAGWSAGMAMKKMADLQKDMAITLTPLDRSKHSGPLDHRLLSEMKILSQKQADSLETGASQWVQKKQVNPGQARSPFTIWLGDKLVAVPLRQLPEEFGYDFEEADLELEMLKELEAENATKDEDFESLHGLTISLADNFTCRKTSNMDAKVQELLRKEEDLWRVPEAYRAAIYRHLQAEMKRHMLAAIREKSKQYDAEALKRRIGYWEKDENILKQQKIIGMTTTGFSKYRALISALQPKIVLIEEAAETLEAPVTVTCVPSLQQLILVGDHRQLRPHTHVKAHEDEPYFLNISLFERMVNNKVTYDVLTKQRRMMPEIRRYLYPIYGSKIKDHHSVTNVEHRPNVRGMGGVNSFFFTHQWSEERDDQMSCVNRTESEMVVSFFQHLIYNGMSVEDITVLTFYNGQRKRILKDLRDRVILPDAGKFKVVTVDSYQGEENEVVILSLTRSNDKHQIGFLNIENRVCVALSRAQCGFYIFGNGMLVHESSKTWRQVIEIFAAQDEENKKHTVSIKPLRLAEKLPIRCSTHDREVEIASPEDWETLALAGGCDLVCGGKLACGHACPLRCHPYPHEEVNCQHCRPKKSDMIAVESRSMTLHQQPSSGSKSRVSSESSTKSWNSYSCTEPRRLAELEASYKKPVEGTLVSLDNAEEDNISHSDDTPRAPFGFSQQVDNTPKAPFGFSQQVIKPNSIEGPRSKWTETFALAVGKAVTHDWSKDKSLLDE